MSDLLEVIISVLNDNSRTEKEREKLILDLTKYVERKRSSELSENRNELEYLRYVRNSLAHRKAIPEEVILVAIPMFWKLLKEITTENNIQKVSNLLAYSLKKKDGFLYSENTSVKSKMRKYEAEFNKFSDRDKILAFENMLLNLYSTDDFQDYLKKKRMNKV